MLSLALYKPALFHAFIVDGHLMVHGSIKSSKRDLLTNMNVLASMSCILVFTPVISFFIFVLSLFLTAEDVEKKFA